MAQRRIASMDADTACPPRTASLHWIMAFMLAALVVTVGTLAGAAPAEGVAAAHAESAAHSDPADVPQCHHDGVPNLPAAMAAGTRGASELSGIDPPDRDSSAGVIVRPAPSATCRGTLTRIPPARPNPRGRPAAYLLTRRFRL